MHTITVVTADLRDARHQDATLHLLNEYSKDPMGEGKELPEYTRKHLIEGLLKHPSAWVFLAFRDQVPVGLAICLLGFSSFAARPLLNIHDLVVLPGYRKQGIGKKLLESASEKAQALGCCKLTLEVLERNADAQSVYLAFGFNEGRKVKEGGNMLFFAKPIPVP